MSEEMSKSIPCLLCGRMLKVKQTKRDKPYLSCGICGTQVFVRFKDGIRKLRRLQRDLGSGMADLVAHQDSMTEILSTVSTLRELEDQLQQAKESKSFAQMVFGDGDHDAAERALEGAIRRTRRRLTRLRGNLTS